MKNPSPYFRPLRAWLVFVAMVLAFGPLSHLAAQSDAAARWPGITVKVDASLPVTVGQELSVLNERFDRLNVTLTNQGTQPLTLDSIQVNIPLADYLTDSMQMIYGGSDMGRTPILRHAISRQGRDSRSSFFGMIQLNPDSHIFVGSTSWRIFMPFISFNEQDFEINSDGEGKLLAPGQTINYEQIVLSRAASWVDLLDQFGDAIAAENGITQLKDVDFKGWATWDYYGRIFTAEDIYGNMAALDQVSFNANMIQIDGGWWTERGDYTNVRPDLEGGIKGIVSRIVASGKIPGLHFDGFRGDAAAEIVRTHPEYFLRDQHGKLIVETVKLVDREMNYTFFDYSHPGARAFIAECVRVMKEEWGVTYFKIDFMRYGLEQDLKKNNPAVTKIQAHDPTLTGVERFRLGMQAMRDAIGPENYFLGCSAVFGPCIGFVDGMRTGADVHPRFEAFSERALGNAGNYYLAGKVFNGDADYLVFRAAADEDDRVFRARHKFGGTLTLNELQMWADFNKVYGNARLQSDNLMTLRDERKKVVREVFEYPAMDETFPIDLWQVATHGSHAFELILSRHGSDSYLGVFNWGTEPKSHQLTAFGLPEPIHLEGRSSAVLKYDGQLTFNQLRKALQPR